MKQYVDNKIVKSDCAQSIDVTAHLRQVICQVLDFPAIFPQ